MWAFLIAFVCTCYMVAFLIKSKRMAHLMSEIKYEMMFQMVGFTAVVDDFQQRPRNKLQEIPERTGEVAVITGGNRGIGEEVIKVLLKSGMKVVMGIRKPEAKRELIKKLQSQGIPQDIEVYELDLMSMKSTKRFAEIIAKTYPEISLLINNAGIMFGKFNLTEEGFESQLATNYLGHFYLTHALLPNLKSTGEKLGKCTRIVNVSSCAHNPGRIYFEDMNMKNNYISSAAYAQSKLAQIMNARYLNSKLESEGAKVKCYSVHPGVVDTDLFEKTSLGNSGKWFMRLMFKTPEEGAVSILHACFSPKIETRGGLYISNCRQGPSNQISKDISAQKRLFELTCEMLNIRNFGLIES